MKKKIFCLLFAVIVTFAAMPVLADGYDDASFSASIFTSSFETARYIEKESGTFWLSPVYIHIGSISSAGEKKAKITPIWRNHINTPVGQYVIATSAGNYLSTLIHTSYNQMSLFLENQNGGTNILISGTWIGYFE